MSRGVVVRAVRVVEILALDVLVPVPGVHNRKEDEAERLHLSANIAFNIVAVGTSAVLGVVVFLVRPSDDGICRSNGRSRTEAGRQDCEPVVLATVTGRQSDDGLRALRKLALVRDQRGEACAVEGGG